MTVQFYCFLMIGFLGIAASLIFSVIMWSRFFARKFVYVEIAKEIDRIALLANPEHTNKQVYTQQNYDFIAESIKDL